MAEVGVEQSSGSSTPLDAGGGVFTGAVNAAFGINQFIDDGQFKLLSDTPPVRPAHFRSASEKRNYKRELAEWEARQAQAAFGDSPFGPGTPGFDLVSNLLGGITDESPFRQQFLDLISQAVEAQTDIFGQSATQLSQLISSGGNPTDVSALVSRGVNQLQEQFSTSGAGLFSSDVQSGAVRLGAELNVGAQEAAQQRLLAALGLGQTFAQSGQTFANRLGNLEEQRKAQFTDAGRARAVISQLSDPQSTNIFSIGAETERNSSGFNFGLF